MKSKKLIGLIAGAVVAVGAVGAIGVIGVKNMTQSQSIQKDKIATKLEITDQQKQAFIEQYGEEAFEVGKGWSEGCFHVDERAELDQEFVDKISEDYTLEQVQITSSIDGHMIPADYILADGNKDCDTMVLSHGYNCNRRMMPGIELVFLEMGYNVLAYDNAGAGENTCEMGTYGAIEQYELLDCIKYVKNEMSEDKKVVACGWSYGGGVVGVSLGNPEVDKLVDFAVLDSPIGDFRENAIVQGEGKEALADQEIVAGYNEEFEMFDKYTKGMFGFSLDDMSAKACIGTSTTPVLIFTSKADEVVPVEQPQAIYDAIKHDKKYIKIFENAPHVGASWMEDTAADYKQTLEEFLAGKLYE